MNANGKIPCSVEILTKNSQASLERCLESVKDFGDIIVLDGNSTDRTREIAARYGARILKQYDTDEDGVAIRDFSEVRNKGLRASFHEWFMFIDSDEYLSHGAVEEIRSIVLSQNPVAQAWWQPRKYVLSGTVIDCATTYPNQQMRFFHKSAVKKFIKPFHERIETVPGISVGVLSGVEYVPLGPLEELKERWQRYIEKELDAYRGASHARIARAIARNSALFVFYALRYFRILVFCRGARMPFSYEWARHSRTLYAIRWLMCRFFRFS